MLFKATKFSYKHTHTAELCIVSPLLQCVLFLLYMKSDLGIDKMSTLAKSASGGIVLILRVPQRRLLREDQTEKAFL